MSPTRTLLFVCAACVFSASVYAQPNAPAGWTQTFNEDFNGNALDAAKWQVQVASGSYGPGNVTVSGGSCRLLARFNPAVLANINGVVGPTPEFAQITTGGAGMFSPTYGYFEARLKVTTGKRSESIFQALSTGGRYSRVDLFREYCRDLSNPQHNDPDFSQTWDTPQGPGISSFETFLFSGTPLYNGGAGDFSTTFHVFGCEWAPDSLTWYLDGQKVDKMKNYNTGPLYLSFANSLRVPAGVGVPINDPPSFEADRNDPTPHYLEIDYVRAWRRNPLNAAAAAAGPAEVALYPNPVRERLTLRTGQPMPYTIRTLLGQAVLRGTTAGGAPTPVAVGGLAAGVYLVELRTGAGRVMRRFSKE